jgi:hypothetical protein
MALFNIPLSATLGPRLEVITAIVCEHHKPEYSPFQDARCKTDPVIRAAVAKLTMSRLMFVTINEYLTTSLSATMTVTGILGCLTVAWWGSVVYFVLLYHSHPCIYAKLADF